MEGGARLLDMWVPSFLGGHSWLQLLPWLVLQRREARREPGMVAGRSGVGRVRATLMQ